MIRRTDDREIVLYFIFQGDDQSESEDGRHTSSIVPIEELISFDATYNSRTNNEFSRANRSMYS